MGSNLRVRMRWVGRSHFPRKSAILTGAGPQILKVMQIAQKELAQAYALIKGDVSDKIQYKFDETKGKAKHTEQPRM
jgi:hypothetical protein